MNVVPFRPRPSGRTWSPQELAALISACETRAASGNSVAAWDTGATESGDPQFYILDDPRAHECRLAISRIGNVYVLENGRGTVLAETRSVDAVASLAASGVKGPRSGGFMGRLLVMLAVVRAAIDEVVTPVLEEGPDILVRLAPQLAGLV